MLSTKRQRVAAIGLLGFELASLFMTAVAYLTAEEDVSVWSALLVGHASMGLVVVLVLFFVWGLDAAYEWIERGRE